MSLECQGTRTSYLWNPDIVWICDDREQLLTTAVEAVPDIRYPSPEPTIWPLLSAIALAALFIGSIFTPWAIVIGTAPLGVGFIAWFWPKSPPSKEPVIE